MWGAHVCMCVCVLYVHRYEISPSPWSSVCYSTSDFNRPLWLWSHIMKNHSPENQSAISCCLANLSHTHQGSQSCKVKLWGSYNTCFIKMLNSQFLTTVLDYSKPSLNLQKGPFHTISFGFDSNKHVNGQKQCIIILPAFLNSEIRLSKLLQQMISIKSRSKKGNSELKGPVFLSHYFSYAQISHKL